MVKDARNKLNQKKKGNRNQAGPSKGGKKRGLVVNKNRVVKSRLGFKSKPNQGAIGKPTASRRALTIKTKAVTVTRTVTDLRQLISQSAKPKPKTAAAQPKPKPKPKPRTIQVSHAAPIVITRPIARLAPVAPRRVKGNSVVISNLNAGISQDDILELFGDVGPITDYQKINASTSMVTFQNPNHATQAVNAYHNRFLDGLPMQCTLIPAPSVQVSGSSVRSMASLRK